MISCLTVTREARFASLERAIADFVRQTWVERELVIVHDGDASFDAKLGTLAASHQGASIAVRREPEGRTLGELRNASVEPRAATSSVNGTTTTATIRAGWNCSSRRCASRTASSAF